jgi:hypothetical protein
MPPYQIREEAYGLSPAQVNALRSYEQDHQRRETLLRTFDQLTDGESQQSSRDDGEQGVSRRATTRDGGRPGSTKRTRDHDVIRRWAEARGGRPVSVRGTSRGGRAGVLRFDFEGYGAGGEELQPISWEEFFRKFDENNLEFIYQDRTRDGKESRFYKFVSASDRSRNKR